MPFELCPVLCPILITNRGKWALSGTRKSGARGMENQSHSKHDGSATVLRIVWRMLPRNGGRALLLVCSYCNTPRRHVYGWEWDSFSGWSNRVKQISWRCCSCARLRYSSEGGYLRPGVMFRAFGNLPCPDLWLPYVFTSIDDPRLDEIVGRIS